MPTKPPSKDAARLLRLDASTAVLEIVAVVARRRGCSVRDLLGTPVGQLIEERVMQLLREALDWEADGEGETPVYEYASHPRTERPTVPARPSSRTLRGMQSPVPTGPPAKKR